jgi:hypothetical protein
VFLICQCTVGEWPQVVRRAERGPISEGLQVVRAAVMSSFDRS